MRSRFFKFFSAHYRVLIASRFKRLKRRGKVAPEKERKMEIGAKRLCLLMAWGVGKKACELLGITNAVVRHSRTPCPKRRELLNRFGQ